jgi:hypothetical protein
MEKEPIVLTDEQIDHIAEKAAAKAVAKMTGMFYQEVGKTVIQRFFMVVGLIAVGVAAGIHYMGGFKG